MDVVSRICTAIRDIPDFPQPGILFKDITPILLDPALCSDIVGAIHQDFSGQKIGGIVGVESRGFLFGMMLAQRFQVPFIPIRKKGKLPYRTVSYEYKLEYGSATMEMHEVRVGDHELAGFSFVVSLDFLNGRDKLNPYGAPVKALVSY